MKTEKSRRDLPMSDAVGNFLRELQRQQRLDKIKHGRQYVNTDFVCRQEDGEGCVGNSIDVAFARAVERAGIPKCRLHDLRHTAATLALKNGANLKEVQEFWGIPTLAQQQISMLMSIWSRKRALPTDWRLHLLVEYLTRFLTFLTARKS